MSTTNRARDKAFTAFRDALRPEACATWQRQMYHLAWRSQVSREIDDLPRAPGTHPPTFGHVARDGTADAQVAALLTLAWMMAPDRVAVYAESGARADSTEKNRLAVAAVIDGTLPPAGDIREADLHPLLRTMVTTYHTDAHSSIRAVAINADNARKLRVGWPEEWEALEHRVLSRHSQQGEEHARDFQRRFAAALSSANLDTGALSFMPQGRSLANLLSRLPENRAARERVFTVVESYLLRHSGADVSARPPLRILLHYPHPPTSRTADLAARTDRPDFEEVVDVAYAWILQLEDELGRAGFTVALDEVETSRQLLEQTYPHVHASPSKNDPGSSEPQPEFSLWFDEDDEGSVADTRFDVAEALLDGTDGMGQEALDVLKLTRRGQELPKGTSGDAMRLALAALGEAVRQAPPDRADDGGPA